MDFSSARAQNLVINGSFEDANTCTEIKQPCSPAAWFYTKPNPTGYSLTPVIAPSTGNRLLQLTVADAISPNRTYWQTMLHCPLIKGSTYELMVDIAAWVEGPNLNDIGFYFSDSLHHYLDDTVLHFSNCLSVTDAKVKRLSNGWFRLRKKFIAAGDQQFLLIGNFSPESNKSIILARKRTQSILLFIDNLSIEPEEKLACPVNQHLVDSLYALRDRHSFLHPALPDTPVVIGAPVIRVDSLTLDNILFDFDRSEIRNPELFDAYRALFAANNIQKILVQGYTDNSGSDAYNLELSKQRALSVARLVSQRFGIPLGRIEWEGRGISHTYEDNKKNRRVELFIYRENK